MPSQQTSQTTTTRKKNLLDQLDEVHPELSDPQNVASVLEDPPGGCQDNEVDACDREGNKATVTPVGRTPIVESSDDDDEAPDDEGSLDEILKRRLGTTPDLEGDMAAQQSDAADLQIDVEDAESEDVNLRQADEFLCVSCFLVCSNSRQAAASPDLCQDCF